MQLCGSLSTVWHCLSLGNAFLNFTRNCKKIIQARLQQYVNRELSDLQGEFRKGRGTKDQIANIHQIIEKAREFQKNIHFCFIDDAKAFDCVGHSKLWKILKEVGIPDHLICLLRNLYAGLLLLLLSRFSRVRLCVTP